MASTVHAKVACSSCHPKHEEYPHPAGVAKPACSSCHTNESLQLTRSVHGEAARAGNAAAPDCSVCHNNAHEVQRPSSAEFRKAIPDTCGMCHDTIAAEFKQSVHGTAIEQGSMKAATCSDCHGEHAIMRPMNPASTVNPRNIPDTCAQCHGGLKLSSKFRIPLNRVESFESSFHGLALKSGQLAVANCASCHGVHNILPSSDPRSTISAKRLPETCGKCHAGAGTRFALGPIHLVEAATEHKAITLIRRFYLVLIPVVLGLMFLHNLGDWIRKLMRLRFVPSVQTTLTREVRMLRAERWQHFLLLTSFGLLTWTGFALVYPDQWWARPLLLFENRWPVRGTLHRAAGVVFMIVTVMHIVTLIVDRKLRERWTHFLPKRNDISDAAKMFAYNVGLRRERPPLPAHSYIEKAEYWAVVWGAVIMIATGLLLWANRWAMAMLPKVVLDIASAVHYYEAILAALAILIWHIYSVILDPEVYPMNTAWLTGVTTRRTAEKELETEEKEEPQHVE
jgi:formate dehydrogenase gamma subunit